MKIKNVADSCILSVGSVFKEARSHNVTRLGLNIVVTLFISEENWLGDVWGTLIFFFKCILCFLTILWCPWPLSVSANLFSNSHDREIENMSDMLLVAGALASK